MKEKLDSEASISIGTSFTYYICTTTFYVLGLFVMELTCV